MYEAHFGLSGPPFGETVRPSAYLPLPGHQAALRRLRYGLEHARGPALLTGPPGAGKTLLAAALAESLGGPSAHLAYPALPADDLLDFLADELDAPPAPGHAVRRVRDRLASIVATGRRPLLVVDEAHLIDDPATFEALRLLLNFASDGTADLDLLLVGGPELSWRLPASLADRLSTRCELDPLTLSESAAYLLGRLAAVGAPRPLFDPPGVASLHHASAGLPRRLNRLADLALVVAYAESLPAPDPRSIALAIADLDPDGLAA